MATLFVKRGERGSRMIQVMVPGRGRATIRLGQIPDRTAERFLDKVETLEGLRRLNQRPDPELAQWLSGLADGLYEKLANIGLIEPREPTTVVPTLKGFLEKYITQKKGEIKPRSIELLEQTKAKLLEHFDGHTPLDEITADGAADWRAALVEDGLSEATVRLHTRNVKSFFNEAVDRELIDRNPFRKLASAAVAADREVYVSLSMAEKVLAHLPDLQHRLLFGLARFGGLRVSSESHSLEWSQVDRARRRLTVHAQKTGATREVPIVPRLMDLLTDAYEARDPEFDQVLLISANNIHRTLLDAIEAAGIKRWNDLFQNLRRNAETDFLKAGAPQHAAAAWLGHGVGVSQRHYVQVTDDMLDAVAGLSGSSALQKALQHGKAPGGTTRQLPKLRQPDDSADAA